MSDYRDTASEMKWWKSINSREMTVKPKSNYMFDGEPNEISFRFTVCDICDGKGSYVNPSIDAHGIGGDEWNEMEQSDRDMYLSGGYDVTCGCCGGQRVIPEPYDEERRKELEEYYQDMAADNAEREAERRMGC